MTYACPLRSADPQWCPGPAARPAAGGPSGRTTSPSYGTYAYAPYRALQDRTRTRMRRPTLAAGLCDSVLPRALRDCVHPAITRPRSSQAAGSRPGFTGPDGPDRARFGRLEHGAPAAPLLSGSGNLELAAGLTEGYLPYVCTVQVRTL